MNRRSYLAATASALVASAAGCVSAGDGDTEATTESRSTTVTSTPATTDDTATPTTAASQVSISDVTVQPAALEVNVDYFVVYDEGQYVFARSTVTEGTVALDDYALRVAGETFEPLTGSERRRLWRYRQTGDYHPDVGGTLAFELPGSVEAADPEAVISHPGGEHELNAGEGARLASAHAFAVELSAPETATVGESLSVEVTVTNEGASPARFVGGLNRYGPRVASIPVEAVRPLVPAGESVTRTIDQSDVTTETADEDVGDGERDATFTLNSVAGSRERRVRVVEEA
ncbi:MAG: hypothetical protein ABEH83_05350 [Halobacterium sp.]